MNEMVDEIFSSLKEDLEKAYSHQQNEYLVIRAGRANPHILDKVMVEYYGVMTPINQMGTISVSEARILNVNIWDASQIKNVVKAIIQADVGITPTDDGKTIRLVFPMLTEERRKELTKQVKSIAEDAKVSVRRRCGSRTELYASEIISLIGHLWVPDIFRGKRFLRLHSFRAVKRPLPVWQKVRQSLRRRFD